MYRLKVHNLISFILDSIFIGFKIQINFTEAAAGVTVLFRTTILQSFEKLKFSFGVCAKHRTAWIKHQN